MKIVFKQSNDKLLYMFTLYMKRHLSKSSEYAHAVLPSVIIIFEKLQIFHTWSFLTFLSPHPVVLPPYWYPLFSSFHLTFIHSFSHPFNIHSFYMLNPSQHINLNFSNQAFFCSTFINTISFYPLFLLYISVKTNPSLYLASFCYCTLDA